MKSQLFKLFFLICGLFHYIRTQSAAPNKTSGFVKIQENPNNISSQNTTSSNISQFSNNSSNDTHNKIESKSHIKFKKVIYTSNVHPGYYDDQNNTQKVAVTEGSASEDHEIILKNSTVKFVTPKIVQSFYYDDDVKKSNQKPITPRIFKRKRSINSKNDDEYYDPARGIYGDRGICDNIQDAIFCIHQIVCGWCPFTQTCRPKNSNDEVLCEKSNYVFEANYDGFDPTLISTEALINAN